ncbi:MAG: isoleucine--tRNA ligase [Christensenellales bacterium]
MHRKVETGLNFVEREKQVLRFWQSNHVFEKCTKAREGAEPFTFYDGPPTANGRPHIGHILTRCIKDLIPRYRSMKGYDVMRKAGWDTHGLPVELEVERQLGLDGKEQIEAHGVEEFIAECKKSVWKYKEEWERMSERVGFWADMESPYITYENDYIESVWWSLKRIHEEGLLYKGHKVVPYCPRCGTALSSHEVAQGYQDVTEDSLFVKFRLKGQKDTHFLAWTTTPWTLPSNVALCVNPKEEYACAEKDGERLILASALVGPVLGEDAKTVWTKPGKALEGLEYQPLFDFQTADKKAWFVVSDPFVTLEEGSGIVHMAPAFGEDDARVCNENGLPFVQWVDERGLFREGTPWAGMFVKEADQYITQALEGAGLLLKSLRYTHSYPFCWRCDTPLLYYARSTWFIRMTALRDKLIKNNEGINWLPEHIKAGRMGNFLENVVDWGLSRERYWGTPLPVWECGCGHIHVIGSVEELRRMSTVPLGDIELHKPYIDRVEIACPACGQAMRRVSEVIDCWYDSGAMPFAQWHYPFENREEFLRRYPANFISEAVDQTRGWFYTLMAISTCLFDKVSFENCIVLGHVQDKEGQKMSKHKGNVVDPWQVLDQQGADAVRWYFYSASMPWLPCRYSDEAVAEGQRKFMGTLWNTYAFYVLYARIDGFNASEYSLEDCQLSLMDRWILSRLNTVTRAINGFLENYRITEAARELGAFVDELSNWYVRRGRERYWGSALSMDKKAAFMTLYTVLEAVARLAAPFVPFIAEEVYQNLVRAIDPGAPGSVHLCGFPVCDEARVDEALEKDMQTVLSVVTLGRACRNASGIRNRQPLSTMYVQGVGSLTEEALAIIAQELNVRRVVFTEDARAFMDFRIKPQLKTLGPRYGKLLPAIRAHLEAADGAAVVAQLESGAPYTFELNGSRIELDRDDLLIETVHREGFVGETEHGVSVVLDTNITPELLEEGYMREIVSKVQTMRKEAGFEVTDHIALYYEGADVIRGIMEKYGDAILKEVLGDRLERGIGGADAKKEWDVNGQRVTLGIRRI